MSNLLYIGKTQDPNNIKRITTIVGYYKEAISACFSQNKLAFGKSEAYGDSS